MEIRRTANAGVLLRLDDVTVLLDGVCREVKPYPATPRTIWEELLREPPDVLAYTHTHEDHYDPAFVAEFVQKTAGPVLGPADVPLCAEGQTQRGKLTITPVDSQHMGKTEPIGHRSYVIQSSKCVWFMGDASPLHWLEKALPRPDVLIAPYGFAIGRGWKIAKALKPGIIVLLHLPEKSDDIYGLWDAVEHTTANGPHPPVLVPYMGETLRLL